MKKILLINILLVIFSIDIEAQYSRLSFVFERFQLTKSYDSAGKYAVVDHSIAFFFDPFSC